MDGLKLERDLLQLVEEEKKKVTQKGEYTVEIRDTYKSGVSCSAFNWLVYVTAPDGTTVQSSIGRDCHYADTMWGAKRAAKKMIAEHRRGNKGKGMTYKVKA